jgi:hypothetical protein
MYGYDIIQDANALAPLGSYGTDDSSPDSAKAREAGSSALGIAVLRFQRLNPFSSA